jgi:hypothetical protein
MLLTSLWPQLFCSALHNRLAIQAFEFSWKGLCVLPSLRVMEKIERMCMLVSYLVVWFVAWHGMSSLVRSLAMLHAQRRVCCTNGIDSITQCECMSQHTNLCVASTLSPQTFAVLLKHLHVLSPLQASSSYPIMPTDRHGVTHAGTLGLFDDDDENYISVERSQRHEIEHLQSQTRRHERREDCKERRELKASSRAAKGKSKLQWPMSWIGKVFARGKSSSPKTSPVRPVGGTDQGGNNEPARERRVKTEWVVVQKRPTPEPVYTADDIDAVDSPWLRECSMVRVKSDDPGGCHVVPKSSIEKND